MAKHIYVLAFGTISFLGIMLLIRPKINVNPARENYSNLTVLKQNIADDLGFKQISLDDLGWKQNISPNIGLTHDLNLSENNSNNNTTTINNNEMEQILSDRREKLKEGCALLGTQENWGSNRRGGYMAIDKWNHYRVCLIGKAGSTSWRMQAKKLQRQNIKEGKDIKILSIRHPLERLFSVYKDKFLGGSPIYKYDAKWRRDTHSGQPWDMRFNTYWLPALKSNHRLLPDSDHQWNTLKQPLESNDVKNENESISKLELSKKYANASFTFEEFINHVIWSHDTRHGDHHWMPQSILCNVCKIHIDYILHLENSSKEIPYLLKKLGFEIDEFKQIHKSNSISNQKPYEEYFNSLPKNMYIRIKELYKCDLDLFY